MNADEDQYIVEGWLISNLFGYCSNNPIVQSDLDGTRSGIALGLWGAITAVASTAKTLLATAATVLMPILTSSTVTVLAGAAIVVLGTYTVVNIIKAVSIHKARTESAEKTAEKSLTKSLEKTKRENYRTDYWVAKLVTYKNGLETFVPTVAVSRQRAISILRSGGNIIASSRGNAKSLALAAGTGKPAIRNPRHYNRATGSNLGYLRHYHEGYRRGGHVFYL